MKGTAKGCQEGEAQGKEAKRDEKMRVELKTDDCFTCIACNFFGRHSRVKLKTIRNTEGAEIRRGHRGRWTRQMKTRRVPIQRKAAAPGVCSLQGIHSRPGMLRPWTLVPDSNTQQWYSDKFIR
ncbi:hypothetical protein RUM44_007913 [Polyplax serrata]|uniref:Uncharacterized protein n=1 Tax=Polyplax serrata TaxID=468196 RepID=A0ABR1B7E2_POLSC